MAAKISFKQQCPSCEAMVPIRDHSLIGKKVDCPKCKYRFVVENPAEAPDAEDEVVHDEVVEDEVPAEEEEEERPAKKAKGGANGITAKKPAGAKADGKAKPGKKRPRDEEDEGGEKKKKAGFLMAMGEYRGIPVLGLVLGVVGIALLGVTCYFMFFSDSGKKPVATRPGPGGPSGPSSSSNTGGGTQETKPDATANAAVPTTASPDISNLLPNDSVIVVNFPMGEFLKSPMGMTAFRTPGAFRSDVLKKTLGFSEGDVERYILAYTRGNWMFHVVRLKQAIEPQTVADALGLMPAAPVNNMPYFVTKKNWIENNLPLVADLSNPNLRPTANPPGTRLLAVYFADDHQTLVLADQSPMQDWLNQGGHPKNQTEPPAPPKEEKKEGEGETAGGENPGGGMSGRAGGGGGGGGGDMMGEMMRRGMARQGGGGGRGGMGGGMPGRGGMPGMGGGSMPGAGQDAPPAVTTSYLTIKPEMKAMLDRAEAKGPVALSAAVDTNFLKDILTLLNPKWTALPNAVAAAVRIKDGEGITAAAELDCGSESAAKDLAERLTKDAQSDLAELGKQLGLKLVMAGQSQGQNANGGGNPMMGRGGMSGMPGGMSGGGMSGMPGGMSGGRGGMSGMPGGMSGGGMSGMPGGMSGGRGGMSGMPGGMSGGRGGMSGMPGGMSGMPGGGMGGMGGGGGGGQQGDKRTDNEVEVKADGKAIQVALNLMDDGAARQSLAKIAEREALQFNASLSMQMARPAMHRLAQALKAYVQAHRGEFPRGTQERQPREGFGLPYAPNERVGWLYELLPYLGHDDISVSIDPKESWGDAHNLSLAMVLIPELLDPHTAPAGWYARYGKPPGLFPTTQWVGIAGVGLDAAEPEFRSKPANAKKLGVFAYDQAVRQDQIKDGPAKTICMIQVPPEYAGPWLAGGGSTVRGVQTSGSVKPFVLPTKYKGKRGTFAIMCDGSVRFIPETMSDATFQALCTIAGGEDVDDLDTQAPLVLREGEVPAKTPVKPAPAAAPPATAPAAPKQAEAKPAAVPAGWEAVNSTEGRFSVLMPGKPQTRVENGQTSFELSPAKGKVFIVTYKDSTAPTSMDDYFRGVITADVNMLQGKLVSTKEITLGAYPGRDLEIQMGPQGNMRIRLYKVGTRLYRLMVGDIAKVGQQDVDRFLDSFKLLGNGK